MRALYLCFGFGLIFGLSTVFSLEDYALYFATRGVTDYTQIWGMPSLSQFTVCEWIKSTDSSPKGTLFSYAVSANSNELLIEYNGNCLKLLVQGEVRVTSVRPNDGMWRHICVSWDNSAGNWKVYKDGVLKQHGSGLKSRQVIRSGGSLIIGQEQDSLGDRFDSTQSFVGMYANINVWDYVLPDSTIKKMAESCMCMREQGNVYKWSDFIHGREGKTRIVIPSPC